MKALALLFLVSAAVSVHASPKAKPLEVYGLTESEAQLNISAIQEQITLVESQKGDSDLRVSLVVVDNGGSTDVSPRASLYLTTFNESEMRGAGSAHMITHMNDLQFVRRVEAGIYEAILTKYNYGEDGCTSGGSSMEGTYKVRIDARNLTMVVRQFRNVEEFGYGFFQDPVFVEYECL